MWRISCLTVAILLIVNEALGCMRSGSSNKIEIGKDSYVCVVFSPLNWTGSTNFQRLAMKAKTDEYATVQVDNSWQSSDTATDTLLNTYGEDVAVHLESMGQVSFQKLFRTNRDGAPVTFPYYTAVIYVEQGEVKAISWDADGCTNCDSGECVDNTYHYDGTIDTNNGKDCFVFDNACTNVDGEVRSYCHLQIYISWTGTDRLGRYFRSQFYRISTYDRSTREDFINGYVDDGSYAAVAT